MREKRPARLVEAIVGVSFMLLASSLRAALPAASVRRPSFCAQTGTHQGLLGVGLRLRGGAAGVPVREGMGASESRAGMGGVGDALSQQPSKKEIKRQRKRLLGAERKRERKQREKEKRQELHALRALQAQNMSAADREEQREREVEDYVERMNERNSFALRRQQALQARGGQQRVAIDLAYSGYMTESEARSLASQLASSHGTNSKAVLPLDLKVVGLNLSSTEGAALQSFEPQRWCQSRAYGANVTTAHLLECYLKEEVVYLTADAEETLSALDPSKVYVIGGLVDRNRHKGCSHRRARELGVATAKLPLSSYSRYRQLKASQILTVNHMVNRYCSSPIIEGCNCSEHLHPSIIAFTSIYYCDAEFARSPITW